MSRLVWADQAAMNRDCESFKALVGSDPTVQQLAAFAKLRLPPPPAWDELTAEQRLWFTLGWRASAESWNAEIEGSAPEKMREVYDVLPDKEKRQ